MSSAAKIRVLVVDDSALVRDVLTRGLSRDPQLEVVGQARDPYEARDLLVQLRPDVITLDLEMPRMDGLAFLRKFMSVMPTPTIVLSSLAAQNDAIVQQARAAGAADVVAKPRVGVARSLEDSMVDLIQRVKRAAKQRPAKHVPREDIVERSAGALEVTTDQVVALGASTGGVAALGRILPSLPAWTPGIIIVQHMAEGFTHSFAKRLDDLCAMKVSEARAGDRVMRGKILVAPGGTRHLTVERVGGEYRIQLREGEPVSGHVPSVDVFFSSVAHCAGKNALGILLTGMGADGARGLLEMRHAGAMTAIQNRETCAVWGMPAAAHQLRAAEQTLALQDIPRSIEGWAQKRAM
jgi:two-component system chemotaxis response regulator CheB